MAINRTLVLLGRKEENKMSEIEKRCVQVHGLVHLDHLDEENVLVEFLVNVVGWCRYSTEFISDFKD
jgi:hypothetical protein